MKLVPIYDPLAKLGVTPDEPYSASAQHLNVDLYYWLSNQICTRLDAMLEEPIRYKLCDGIDAQSRPATAG